MGGETRSAHTPWLARTHTAAAFPLRSSVFRLVPVRLLRRRGSEAETKQILSQYKNLSPTNSLQLSPLLLHPSVVVDTPFPFHLSPLNPFLFFVVGVSAHSIETMASQQDKSFMGMPVSFEAPISCYLPSFRNASISDQPHPSTMALDGIESDVALLSCAPYSTFPSCESCVVDGIPAPFSRASRAESTSQDRRRVSHRAIANVPSPRASWWTS